MTIMVKKGIPSSEKIWPLFLSTGWNDEYALSPQELSSALFNSWYTVSAYDDERLVGFGRVVSDGGLHAMIYDLIIDPGYQERGIGSQVLERLVERCLEANIRDIQLFCARGKEEFYRKRGFIARPSDAPGMEYRRAVASHDQSAMNPA